jgi:hypothetical protein
MSNDCVTFPFSPLFIVMKKNLFAAAFLVGGLVYAHHSPAASYFLDQTVVLRGTVTEFLFRNPHSWLQVDAPDETGQMRRWDIEWGAGGQLGSRGIGRDTFKMGDEVTITIMPGKDPKAHRGLVKILRRRSDGFEWGTKPGEDLTHWGVGPLGGTR